ncbi:MAG: hypothetical protein LW697_14005 [Blastopirellula sp.]|nr:hypothetical protein [Blastopirellula sp.]
MLWFRLRPTFEIPLPLDRGEVIERFRRAEQQVAKPELFRMFGEYGELHLPRPEHRLWSPHLSFYVSEPGPGVGAGHCSIHGRFAPRVDVWTVVWIAYLALLFTSFFGAALGVSQWQLGDSMWGLWVAAGALVLLGTLYLVAHLGQQWSSDQMHQLRAHLEEIMRGARVQSREL